MKLKEIEEKVLLGALYGKIDTFVWNNTGNRLSVSSNNIEKLLSEAEAFENLTKILVEKFEIKESEMTYIRHKLDYIKEHFIGWIKTIEYRKKTGSLPETQI